MGSSGSKPRGCGGVMGIFGKRSIKNKKKKMIVSSFSDADKLRKLDSSVSIANPTYQGIFIYFIVLFLIKNVILIGPNLFCDLFVIGCANCYILIYQYIRFLSIGWVWIQMYQLCSWGERRGYPMNPSF